MKDICAHICANPCVCKNVSLINMSTYKIRNLSFVSTWCVVIYVMYCQLSVFVFLSNRHWAACRPRPADMLSFSLFSPTLSLLLFTPFTVITPLQISLVTRSSGSTYSAVNLLAWVWPQLLSEINRFHFWLFTQTVTVNYSHNVCAATMWSICLHLCLSFFIFPPKNATCHILIWNLIWKWSHTLFEPFKF